MGSQHRRYDSLLETVKRVETTSEPEWVVLGPARLKIGPATSDPQQMLYMLRDQIYAAACRNQRASSALSGAPFFNCRVGSVTVLAEVLEHRYR